MYAHVLYYRYMLTHLKTQNLDLAGVKSLVTILNGIDVTGAEVVVAPVAIHIPEVVATLKKDIAVASQNANFKVCFKHCS